MSLMIWLSTIIGCSPFRLMLGALGSFQQDICHRDARSDIKPKMWENGSIGNSCLLPKYAFVGNSDAMCKSPMCSNGEFSELSANLRELLSHPAMSRLIGRSGVPHHSDLDRVKGQRARD